MIISLHTIVPDPIKNSYSKSSDIWGKELIIESGTKVHVSAPSGTGKTTCTHILYGMRHDFEGKLLVDGKDSKSLKIDDWSALRQKQISIIYQDLKLIDSLSGFDNIEIKNVLTGHLTKNQIEEFAENLGVSHVLYKKCAEMSRGERQRIAIIRSLAQPFKLLLLDEAFSHLDEANTDKAIGLINSRLKIEGAGVVVSNLFEDTYFDYDLKLQL